MTGGHAVGGHAVGGHTGGTRAGGTRAGGERFLGCAVLVDQLAGRTEAPLRWTICRRSPTCEPKAARPVLVSWAEVRGRLPTKLLRISMYPAVSSVVSCLDRAESSNG